MRLPIQLTLLASLAGSAMALPATDTAAPPPNVKVAAHPLPDLPWNAQNDASPAFTPGGRVLLFTRGRGIARRIVISERTDQGWSSPQPASFSGDAWMDMEPAMAPDGSFLIFASNRPSTPGGQALDGAYEGQAQPGRGGNLWRVDRRNGAWSAPSRLPDAVNAGTSVYAPAVAADGSLFFMKSDPATGHFRLYVSRVALGGYQAAQPLAFSTGSVSDYDPAIAPDQSFIVFSSDRPPSSATDSAIFIAFAIPGGWSTPVPLGPSGTESRWSPDGATLYYSGADKRIHDFPLRDWLKRRAKAG